MSLPIAILAGGLATRMHPVTERIPKALLDVHGKPFMVRQLECLRRHGVTQVVACVGHLGEMIYETIGDGNAFGVEVRYSFDGERLRGTGGALYNALPMLGARFFVLYGDSYLDCDYSQVEEAFLVCDKLGLMTLFRNENKWDKSNVLFRDGIIKRYDKKSPTQDMKYIDYGLGVLSAEAFEAFREQSVLDLSAIYMHLISQNSMAGLEMQQRFYEIGSPSGLEATRRYFTQMEVDE